MSEKQLGLPAVALSGQLSRHLKSFEGPEGISALAARILDKWNSLTSARIDDRDVDDAKSLGTAFVQIAKGCDRGDLVGKDIPLRSVLGGQTLGDFKLGADVNVCAKIALSIAETLFQDEVLEFLELTIQALTSAGKTTINDDAFILRIACIDLYLKAGNHDAAATAARTNLAFGCCPTSQFLLYKALVGASNSDARASSTETCIDDLSDRFCSEPFSTLATGTGARKMGEPPFFACQCPGTLPYPVSNYEKGVTIRVPLERARNTGVAPLHPGWRLYLLQPNALSGNHRQNLAQTHGNQRPSLARHHRQSANPTDNSSHQTDAWS